MEQLVKDFRIEIPHGLQSEDYENAINAYFSAANDTKARLYTELEKLAKSKNFVLKSTKMGIETIPIVDGRTLSEKDYSKLSDEQREQIESERSDFEPEILDFARKVRTIDKETREHVDTLRNSLVERIVLALIGPLLDEYKDNEIICTYLNSVVEDVKENLVNFIEDDSESEEALHPSEEKERFNRYRVNLFIDNSVVSQAPIVIENNPTYYNLFGKIEKNVEHGMYLTDFTYDKTRLDSSCQRRLLGS